jgi:murein DD-endopeptidase MepM/ murein hydrolase activator NlpD
MFGLVGGAMGAVLGTATLLFSLIVFVTILQLPFGKAQAWEWYLGRPISLDPPELEAGDVSHLGLDPRALVEWFGGPITSGFHDPSRPYHSGIDFSLVTGTPVRSTWEGQVVYAGMSGAGYGNLVVVENGSWRMVYAHLSGINVSVGQGVRTGTLLGLSGNTGRSTGPHLHYEVRHHGVPVDPVSAPTGGDR